MDDNEFTIVDEYQCSLCVYASGCSVSGNKCPICGPYLEEDNDETD